MSTDNDRQQSGTLAGLIRESLRESDESARAYLLQGWLSGVMVTLRDARRRAGLTQTEVAQRLGTTQSAVARLEKDYEGRYSLQRYAEYLAACGELPLTIETIAETALRDYALAEPDAPRTGTAYHTWCAKRAVTMFSIPHRQGTAEIDFDAVEEDLSQATPKKQHHRSFSILQGGLAEPFGDFIDAEAVAV